MLKKKLTAKAYTITNNSNNLINDKNNETSLKTSKFFATPLWQNFYNFECQLNETMRQLCPGPEIFHIYNPIEYAAQIHCEYLRHYLKGSKKLLFIGMNPGPDGMGQTGVPFGNITTVKDIMQLHGLVEEPPNMHPKRPIEGLECTKEEPSGKRLWTLFQQLANGSLELFFQQCFVHNYCPLAFFDRNGRNITPSELKGPYKLQVRDECLRTTEHLLQLVQPEIIVAVGDYVFKCLQKSVYCKDKRLLRLAHPSPRSLNNTNWPEKAEKFLREEDLFRYFTNEKNLI